MKRFVNSMIKSMRHLNHHDAAARSTTDGQPQGMSEIAYELLKQISGGDDLADSPKGSWGLPPVVA